MWRGLIFSLLALLVIYGGLARFAQAQGLPTLGDNLDLAVSPSAPGPDSPVSLSLTDYSIDLQTADIRWLVNGKLAARGSGQNVFETRTGPAGALTTITAIVITKDGQTLTKTLSLRPALLDLLWQADSAVPPLYRGKALPTTKNLVQFLALPHFMNGGREFDPSKLLYQWSLDFDPVPGASGLGRDSFKTQIVDLIGETRVSVKVSNLDGTMAASKSITVSPVNPLVTLVRLNDLEGPDLDHPLSGNYQLDAPEITLRALGYYFPQSHLGKPGLLYRFDLNGRPATTTGGTPQLLTLRHENNLSGQARLSVAIGDPFDNMISAAQNLLIDFGSAAFK